MEKNTIIGPSGSNTHVAERLLSKCHTEISVRVCSPLQIRMCGGIIIRERNPIVSILIMIILLSINFSMISGSEISEDEMIERSIPASNDLQHFGGSGVLFSNPRNLTLNEKWFGMAVTDLDGDGFPQVIVTNIDNFYDNISYERGHHSFQFDDKGNLTRSLLDVPEAFRNYTPSKLIDLDEDEDLDLLVAAYIILEVENGNFTGNGVSPVFGNPVITSVVSDIDCDGDYDIAGESGNSNIFFSRMEDNGSFNGTGWDTGIPRKPATSNSPKYISHDHAMEDINNDGWPDICSAMGNGGSWWNTGPCQYYNWVSSGDGAWSSHSKGFPTYEMGLNLALSDIDNDQDLDYALITDTGKYLFENVNGTGWKQRNFPTSLNIDEMLFDDIDEDGFQDMIYYINENVYDENDVIVNKNTTLWIAYGSGDFKWQNVKQFEKFGGDSYFPHIVDMDRDGDKDIVMMSSFVKNYWTFQGNILFCENNMNSSRNITVIETPRSPHLRSGSIHRLSWTMVNASNNMDQRFNISISYTGRYGSYIPIRTGFQGWWTEMIIPDIPSEEVYIKVEGNPFSNVVGPYVIHNSEDRSTLANLVSPPEGGSVVSGNVVEMVIDTSSSFPEGMTDLTVFHNNGSIDAGTHLIQPGQNNTISFNIAQGVFELDCELELSFTWAEADVDLRLKEVFDIVPPAEIPDHVDIDEIHVPCNVTWDFGLCAFTISDKNITRDSSYQAEFNEYEMEVSVLGKGSFSVRVFKMGTYNMSVVANRFGQRIEQDITVHSHLPLSSITVIFDSNSVNVGETVGVSILGRDFFGEYIPLKDSYLNWTVEGESIPIWTDDDLSIQATTPGQIRVIAEVDVGLGALLSESTIDVGNSISFVRIRVEKIKMMTGQSQICWVEVVGNSSMNLEDYDVKWFASENAVLNTTTGRSVMVNATVHGEMDLQATVTYYNETSIARKKIDVIPGLDDIVLVEEIRFEVGTELLVRFTVMGSDGKEFDGSMVVAVKSLNTSIAVVTKDGNHLLIQGLKSGSTNLEIQVISGDVNITKKFLLAVEGFARSIVVEIPPIVQLGDIFEVQIRAYDNVGDHLRGSVIVFDTDLYLVQIGYNITFKAMYLGVNDLKVTYEDHPHYLSTTVSTFVVPNAFRIQPAGQEYVIKVGHTQRIEPYLETEYKEVIEIEDWNITCSDRLECGFFPGHFLTWSNFTGEYWLSLSVDYYGEHIESNITILVIDPVRIDSYQILELGNGLIEILVLDQFGNDITESCEITWQGDFKSIDQYRVRPGKDGVDVFITFNGTTVNGHFGPLQEIINDKNETSYGWIWILVIAFIILLLGAGVAIFFILRTRGENEPKNDEVNMVDQGSPLVHLDR